MKKTRLGIDIPIDVKRSFAVECTKKGTKMNLVLLNFIDKFIKKQVAKSTKNAN